MIMDSVGKRNKKIQKIVPSPGSVPTLTERESHEEGSELLAIHIKIDGAFLRESAGIIKTSSLHGGINKNVRKQNTGHHVQEALEQSPADAVPPAFG